jgi:hypothetical protein
MLAGSSGSPTVNNFYSSPALLRNVGEYFNALIAYSYSGDLLVGEAPGYAGCALTGIPFTSEQVIRSSPHPFITALRSRLKVSGTQSEPTATIMWAHLTTSSRLPAFWNAFPFHPHDAGSHRNRPPEPAELAFGASVLAAVLEILTPNRVFAIGRTTERTLRTHFPSLAAPYIRHPALSKPPAFSSALVAYGIV